MCNESPLRGPESPKSEAANGDTNRHPMQLQLMPSREFLNLIAQLKPPFYRSSAFWFSVIALLVSITVAFFNFLSSPLSQYTKPNIEYMSEVSVIEQGGDSAYRMFGVITNHSNNSAQDLIVAVVTGSLKPAPRIVVQSNILYAIEKNAEAVVLIRFPTFPPDFECIIIVDSIGEEPAKLASLGWPVPRINNVSFLGGQGKPSADKFKAGDKTFRSQPIDSIIPIK